MDRHSYLSNRRFSICKQIEWFEIRLCTVNCKLGLNRVCDERIRVKSKEKFYGLFKWAYACVWSFFVLNFIILIISFSSARDKQLKHSGFFLSLSLKFSDWTVTFLDRRIHIYLCFFESGYTLSYALIYCHTVRRRSKSRISIFESKAPWSCWWNAKQSKEIEWKKNSI